MSGVNLKENRTLNFFTLAFGRYKMFALPYITAALHFNRGAFVEIITDNPQFLKKKHRKFIQKYYSNRCLIRGIPEQFSKWGHHKLLKSIRWFTIPKIKTKYTYIGDIDIIILDSNLHIGHVKHANEINKPYSNIVRTNGINMTGLHFVITKPYYQKMNQAYLNQVVQQVKLGKIRAKQLDERILCRMVKAKFGLPSSRSYRPGHGIHFSLHRAIMKWSGDGVLPPAFDELCKTDAWKEGMNSVFDERFKKVIRVYINSAIPLAKRDYELGNKINRKEYSSEKELKKWRKERTKIRSIRIKLQ